MKKDLQELPLLKDSVSFIYFEKARIEQMDSSIVVIQADGRIPVPIASTTCLLLGPGTSITHSAIKAVADNGGMIEWCGDRMSSFYAFGNGETRSAKNLLKQAELCMNDESHLKVVRKMYEIRFPKLPQNELSLQKIRGMEGARMRKVYQFAAKMNGIKWTGRNYKTDNWDDSDPINQALSMANAYLYSICHACIISLGYSPGLGFIHTGKNLSFVYDVGDFYKAETTIPAAFAAVKNTNGLLEANVRMYCRQYFIKIGLLKRIAMDIAWVFDMDEGFREAKPVGDLWDDSGETVFGGKNYSNEEDDEW